MNLHNFIQWSIAIMTAVILVLTYLGYRCVRRPKLKLPKYLVVVLIHSGIAGTGDDYPLCNRNPNIPWAVNAGDLVLFKKEMAVKYEDRGVLTILKPAELSREQVLSLQQRFKHVLS